MQAITPSENAIISPTALLIGVEEAGPGSLNDPAVIDNGIEQLKKLVYPSQSNKYSIGDKLCLKIKNAQNVQVKMSDVKGKMGKITKAVGDKTKGAVKGNRRLNPFKNNETTEVFRYDYLWYGSRHWCTNTK